MRILFCNIAWMNYYKGIVWGKDEPQNGGSYVKETLDAHEKYNFEAIPLTEESGYPKGEYCLGFVETKSTNKETRNQLRIEKIYGCEGMNEETSVDDVLVVYCALYPDAIEKETYVVGWYKHATVYRNCKVMRFLSDTEEEYYDQAYNAIAKKEDCCCQEEQGEKQIHGKYQENQKVWRMDLDSLMYGMHREENRIIY